MKKWPLIVLGGLVCCSTPDVHPPLLADCPTCTNAVLSPGGGADGGVDGSPDGSSSDASTDALEDVTDAPLDTNSTGG